MHQQSLTVVLLNKLPQKMMTLKFPKRKLLKSKRKKQIQTIQAHPHIVTNKPNRKQQMIRKNVIIAKISIIRNALEGTSNLFMKEKNHFPVLLATKSSQIHRDCRGTITKFMRNRSYFLANIAVKVTHDLTTLKVTSDMFMKILQNLPVNLVTKGMRNHVNLNVTSKLFMKKQYFLVNFATKFIRMLMISIVISKKATKMINLKLIIQITANHLKKN